MLFFFPINRIPEWWRSEGVIKKRLPQQMCFRKCGLALGMGRVFRDKRNEYNGKQTASVSKYGFGVGV